MRIAHVTCAQLPEPDVDEHLTLAAFQSRGHEIETVAWDRPAEWSSFDLAILRSPWNYPNFAPKFLTWVKEVSTETQLLNPAEVVLWNLDKHYLRALDVPCVPTTFGTAGHLDIPGEGKFVVKPTIGAGSMDTRFFESGEETEARDWLKDFPPDKGFMVQPYQNSVNTVGEQSIVVIGDTPTHRITKRPRFSDQEESVMGPFPVDPPFEAIARQALASFGSLLYARVDLIQSDQGEWLVSELELIEPSLFFLQNPKALSTFVSRAEELAR